MSYLRLKTNPHRNWGIPRGDKEFLTPKEVYADPRWKECRAKVYERCEGVCKHCEYRGRIVAGAEVHHIYALTTVRGMADPFNPYTCILLCKECHMKVHGKPVRPRVHKAWKETVDELAE